MLLYAHQYLQTECGYSGSDRRQTIALAGGGGFDEIWMISEGDVNEQEHYLFQWHFPNMADCRSPRTRDNRIGLAVTQVLRGIESFVC